MATLESVDKEIKKIKQRNKKVEGDKAWETSLSRKLLITLFTYVVIVIFFYFAGLPKPFVNSIVPTVGFVLSHLPYLCLRKCG